MRFRGNVLLHYSLAIFLAVAIVTALLGSIVTTAIADYEIRSHIRLYPEIVRLLISDPAQLYATLESRDGADLAPETTRVLRGLLTLGSIYRVKVWDPTAKIVWSDEGELIGKRFEDDDAFHEAMGGRLTFERGEADKAENVYEAGKGDTLQIYTPVLEGAKVVGVLELYEADKVLFSTIAKNTLSIWATVIVGGAVLYLLLFFVFYQAHKTQKTKDEQLIQTQDVTIFALAYQAELRDRETGKHLERASAYVRLLAEELRKLPALRRYLTRKYIDDLVQSAPLHDIGKVGVPDSILLKPGKLSPDERAQMEKHCEYGARVLTRAQQKLKFQSFLAIAIQLAIGHHERWDGEGYPQGLAGTAIPLSARIMSLADVYDALRSKRVYKKPIGHETCVELIRGERGKQFDPAIVDAFMNRERDFRAVSERLADEIED